MMENWKYTAFISYRHGGTDEFVAKTLHAMLESYRIPRRLSGKLGKKRVGRIFRDVDELPSSSSLYHNIEEALGQSEFLLVICTPRLQESQWCMREIELFKKLRGSDHIIAVLAEGEPQDSFPYEITHRLENGKIVELEPLAADVRGKTPAEQKKKMKVEKLRILAAMLHCEFDQLRQRDRQRKLQRGIAAGGVGFAVISAFLAQTIWENQKLQTQVKKTQSAQSYLLAEYSDTALSADNPKLAALLAMEGLPTDLGDDRPFEGAAMASLTKALQTYDYQKGYTVRNNVQTQTMDALLVSPYDDYIAYIDLVSSTKYTLHMYDIEKNEEVASFPMDPDYGGYRSCNSKIAFFGDHRCAIAGAEGIQVIDMNTMEVLWQGVKCMTVSASADGSVLSAFNADTDTVTFYTSEGELLSEYSTDGDDAIFFGLSGDGTYAAMTEVWEDDSSRPLHIIDTHTGETAKLLDKYLYKNIVFNDTSWWGDLLFFAYKADKYGYLDMSSGDIYLTDTVIDTDICHVDLDRERIYYRDGMDLNCVDLRTGEQLQSYQAGKSITDAVYTGDGTTETFALYCDDGSIEDVDYTEEPYLIGRLGGDGAECSEICTGKNYLASYAFNAYEFRIYQLNDKSAARKGSLKKRSSETLAFLGRQDALLSINGNENSYMLNLDTLTGAEFDMKVSYMSTVTDSIVYCDELDGTVDFYDAQTGELLVTLPDTVLGFTEVDGAYVVEDGLLKKYSYEKNDSPADEVEPVYTEEVPEGCTQALLCQNGYLVGSKETDEENTDLLFILDQDRKEVFSAKVSNYMNSVTKDYVVYHPTDSNEYVLYNYVEGKEITRMDLGDFSWVAYINGGYLFLCSSDKGAFILDETTGEVVLTIPDAGNIYTFDAPEGQPYFTALSLSDNGETRLDVYAKDALSSPIAKIKGGLGMNKEGEVVIYDGDETVYAVPFLSMEEQYQNGKDFLGGLTLTQEQKEQYHCD